MKARYHQEGGSIELDVISKAKDGKVDLGRDEAVVVAGVTVSDTAALGTCTLIKDEDPKAAFKAAAKAARTRATQLAKAAAEASKAADQAKGKEGHEALVKAAAEAAEAAKQAESEADTAELAAK